MIRNIDFSEQISIDQKRYSRYVCDSRAIANSIDGLKPVQRRILWTMWNSKARNLFTKTVKVSGMTMAYHPHGNTSIDDAIAQMVQDFTFANNYPLISGEGTFGDIIDPKAIASPRYTEVKISNFAKDVGLFESIQDIDYVSNYDETEKEPIFFVPKIPIILLNPIMGIATGFKCNMAGHKLYDISQAMIKCLKGLRIPKILPWYKNYKGRSNYLKIAEKNSNVFVTNFHFEEINGSYFLTQAPQNWNREKTINYIESILKNYEEIKDYLDHSKDSFMIEIIFKKGIKRSIKDLEEIFNKQNKEVLVQNVITYEGKLLNKSNEEIIEEFIYFRKIHLKRRFKRLAIIEEEKINKQTELIRFIKEKWNSKVTKIKNRKDLEAELKKAKFFFSDWLCDIPIYRITLEEVSKCKQIIKDAEKLYKKYVRLFEEENILVKFMINEINELSKKWDKSI